MPGVRVVTDSTADFPPGVAEKLGISVVPLSVIFGDESFLDKEELPIAAFYERLRSTKVMPSTSAPSPGLFKQTYERLLEEADHVISVHIAAKLSATWSVATAVAREVAPDRITVLDSKQLTLCLGWAAAHAAERAAQETPVDTIVRELESMFPRLRVYPALDTLEFLQRGGRIGKASALLGTLLNVKPILLIQNGEVLPLERARTRQGALKRLKEIPDSLAGIERLGVLHGDATDAAQELVAYFRERFPQMDLPTGEIGAVLGTHAGPGVFGIVCLIKE